MWEKIENYYWTLKYLKMSQMYHLVKNRLDRGKKAVTEAKAPKEKPLPLWIGELDDAPEYLGRFDVEELLDGQVTLLYESGSPGGTNWEHPDRSRLWNFNLHYLEFLIPLAAAYRRERDRRYYDCFRDYCRRWIGDNREGTGDGWHPYTISLRLTNLWICMDGFGEVFREDPTFRQELNDSMYAQYVHLQKKQELHLLGNHYFENLKTVLLGSYYFQEPEVLRIYTKKFRGELNEQILSDGVHYERSLMYHKIVLEDILRVAKAVRQQDAPLPEDSEGFCRELHQTLQQMADAAWSLEKGMGQTPLFNDSGDNVARPLGSLLDGLKAECGIVPEQKKRFPQAGYYCLERDRIRLNLDAGEIGPPYMPGHGHCDGLSFELSLGGKPLFVNSGTGQYQGPFRAWFRSTAAHNTVVMVREEQSRCWGEHRVGRRISNVSGDCGELWAEGMLTTCTGRQQKRRIFLQEPRTPSWEEESHGTEPQVLQIHDWVEGYARAYFHLAPEYEYVQEGQRIRIRPRGEEGQAVCEIQTVRTDEVRIWTRGEICSYAPEFGRLEQIQVLEIAWDGAGGRHEIKMYFI